MKTAKQTKKKLTGQALTLRKLRAGLRTKLTSPSGLFDLISEGLDSINVSITELAVSRDTQRVVDAFDRFTDGYLELMKDPDVPEPIRVRLERLWEEGDPDGNFDCVIVESVRGMFVF